MSGISDKNLFVSKEEIELILNSITFGERKYRVLLLLIANGCRPCEAVNLHVNDFITANFTQFYVDNTKVVRKGKLPRRDLKVIPKWVAKELKEYVEQCFLTGQMNCGYLFNTNAPNKRSHMSTQTFITWFARRRKKLGLNDVVGWHPANKKLIAKGIFKVPQYRIGIYSFRRYLATEETKRGVPLQFTAARMSHLDTRVTMRYVDKQQLLNLLPEIVERSPRFMIHNQKRLSEFI